MAFTQYYESTHLDASLLLIPQVGFLPPSDPRVVGTVEAIQRELGRVKEARDLFDRLLSLRNDLGHFSEKYDQERRRLIGKFPQVFTHLTLIASAVAFTEAAEGEPAPPDRG